jgi:dTDP-N-acetylfucosamine:lipid II N-acetylfucosaminyltransferase
LIVHLLSDPDFNNLIIHQFEVANPKKNIFVVYTNEQISKLSKIYPNVNIYLIDSKKMIFNFDGVNAIIIHCMSLNSAKFIMQAPLNIPVLWSIFGVDLYNFMPSLINKIYGLKTRNYLYGNSFISKIKFRLKVYLSFKLKSSNLIQRNAIKRVNMYSTVVPSEIEIAKPYLPKKCEYIKLCVGHLHFINEDSIETYNERKINQYNIYIGNSGNESNNHLELIDEIQLLDSNRFKVNLQLSYGGSQNYVSTIEQIYYSKFKNNLNIIKTWMNKDDYYNLINSQDIFLFNSIRQQGVGAIIMAVWCGAKVFLNEQNPVFKYFSNIGIKVFSIQKNISNINKFEPLNKEDVFTNRQILLKEYSFENINENTKKAVTILNNYFKYKKIEL